MREKKSTIAIIPARGGSKRIPRKNIRSFAGKPMIYWSINAALQSNLFDQVVVSTDDQEIAEVAVGAGASVPFIRPAQLADDFAGTDAVLKHALEWLENKGNKVDYACCIYPTAPFVTPASLLAGLDKLRANAAATVMAITSYAYPIFRSLKIGGQGKLEMFWPEHKMTRSQDLPEAFHDAGQFYWLDIQKYRHSWAIIGDSLSGVYIPRHLVQDIDTEEDWLVAERLFRAQLESACNQVISC